LARSFKQELASTSPLANMVANIEPYTSEPTTLLSFNNMVSWTNTNNQGNMIEYFLTDWSAGWSADVKSSFAWGVGKDINTTTGETEHLYWSPYADIYGYGHAYVEVNATNAMVNMSVDFTPMNIHLLEIDFQLTNGFCIDISTFSHPVHFEMNVNFGWRTCGFGLFEWINTNNKSKLELCPMTYYGTN